MEFNYYAIRNQVQAMADSIHLNLVYKGDIDTAYTDGSNIYVPTPSPEWPEEKMVLWQYYVYHELGHNVPHCRDCFDIIKEKEIHMKSFFGSCMNLLEDNRQEYYKFDEYVGKKNVMSRGRKIFLNRDLDRMGKDEDLHRQAMETLFVWDTWHRASWIRDLSGIDEKMEKYITEQSRGWLQTLKHGNYKDAMYSCDTAEDVYNLTKRIINEVFKFDADEEEKDAQEQYKEAEQNDEGEEDGKQEHRGKKAKGSRGNEDSDTRTEQDSSVKYSDLLVHQHEGNNRYGSVTSLHIEYDTEDTGYIPAVNVKLLDFQHNKFDISPEPSWYGAEHYREQIHSIQAGNGFATKIRKLLQVYSQSRYEYSQKRGKLHNKSVYKATMRESGEYQNKIFKQKYDNNIIDTAVTVLVDLSRSMGGEKYTHAAHSAILLNAATAHIGVNTEILGFTEQEDDDVVHAVFKSFGTTLQDEKLSEYFVKASQYMGNNADGESIQWAYERLIQQPNKRKLLIVLSDGSPASGRSGIYSYTKNVVQELEKRIEVYGIGIMNNNVKNIYKNNTVIRSADELERALLTVIKDKVIKR